MDVIEDLQNILLVVLDYLGINVDELVRNIRRNRERGVRRRSLVRLIASILPRKPARRIRLQSHLLGPSQLVYRHGSTESINTCFSTTSSEDLQWVEEDWGENCIHYRVEKRDSDEECDIINATDDATFLIQRKEMTSTPLNQSLSMLSNMTQDASTVLKLTAMEEELAALRKQIALLVLTQETNKSIRVDPDGASIPLPAVCPPPPPAPPLPPSCPPPPPPPLPPPPPSTAVPGIKPKASGMSLAALLKQQKSGLQTAEDSNRPSNSTATDGVPDMSQILKGLGTVKLKSIKRSPGGTPVRGKPNSDSLDAASIIAQALKKKFAHRRLYSPELDKENNPDFSSPDMSPRLPFGQHILKKTRRRSSLVKDTTPKKRSSLSRDGTPKRRSAHNNLTPTTQDTSASTPTNDSSTFTDTTPVAQSSPVLKIRNS
ncbi:mitochondrial fission regulator 2-like [Haliotis rubra]|uniref:mitochondrial fission regulator 2-like n=1 Tax=Haliotis rubra TaxID=36100 RepID=UPI001EE5C3D6|nr:mitochondrial fission regulator 2-like [Haliotis rubra]XP_046566807.1 mitochondrial fission regulator 2-like [Haliotis rubra]